MNRITCDDISVQLVEYADGELSPSASVGISDHLKECKDCRDKVSALTLSLRAAKLVWQESEIELIDIDRHQHHRRPKRSYSWATALAASIALLAGVAFFRHYFTPSPGPQPSAIAIETEINRIGTAAQLLAVADLLAEQEGDLAHTREGYRYVAVHYSDTEYGAQARLKLQVLERSQQK